MSLIQWLTVGHSLQAPHKDSGRYNMPRYTPLPKFAPVGRPVSLKPRADGAPDECRSSRTAVMASAQAVAVPEPVVVAVAEAPMSPSRTDDSDHGRITVEEGIRPANPFAAGPVAIPVAAEAETPGVSVPIRPASSILPVQPAEVESEARVAKQGLLQRLGLRRPERPSRPLVQAELRLDDVKVVRNDLAGDDVEVKPRRISLPAPGSKAGGPSPIPAPPLAVSEAGRSAGHGRATRGGWASKAFAAVCRVIGIQNHGA
jgi:hypothetical protein